MIYSFFLIFLIIPIILTENPSSDKTVLLLGDIRSGKSCFVNTIFKNKLALVGDDDGEPTTENTNEYVNTIFNYSNSTDSSSDFIDLKLIDTKGLNNNMIDLLFLYKMLNYLIDQKYDIHNIMLFYSLNQENETLKRNLDKIKFFFDNFKAFTLVITKQHENEQDKRKNINKILYSSNIDNSHIIRFASDCAKIQNSKSDAIIRQIFPMLKTQINGSYSLENLYDKMKSLNKTIDTEAKELNVTVTEEFILDTLENLYRESKDENNYVKKQIETSAYNSLIIKFVASIMILLIPILFMSGVCQKKTIQEEKRKKEEEEKKEKEKEEKEKIKEVEKEEKRKEVEKEEKRKKEEENIIQKVNQLTLESNTDTSNCQSTDQTKPKQMIHFLTN